MSLAKTLTRGTLMFGAWLSLVAAAGCTSKETAEVPGPKYPTGASYCKALAETLCTQTLVEACYLSSADSLAADTDACKAAFENNANCNPNGFGYDVEPAETCINRIANLYADAKLTQAELTKYPDLVYTSDGRIVCISAFNAGGGEGSACTADQDCNVGEGLACVIKTAAGGTCQVPEVVAAAEVCTGPAQQCDEAADLYCGSDDQCIRKPDVGGACSLVDPVVPCRDNALCVNNVCGAKAPNGDPCTGNEQCEGGFCVRASGATDGTCGAQLVLSPTTGLSCDPFLGQ